MGEILPPSAARQGCALPAVSVAFTGPGSIVVRVSGELDAVGAPVLESELERVWSCGARRVTVDLAEVTFLGVAGLHCLVRARATAREHRVRLAVTGGSGHMERLLELAGAGDVTEPSSTVAAVAKVGPPDRRDAAMRTAADPGLAPVLRALRWSSAHRAGDLPDALRTVTETAAAHLPGVEGAGVLLVDGSGGVVSYAATDPVVTVLDLVQQRSRSGPAWQSAWTGVDVVVHDLVVDPRWPELVAETAGLGVRSLLCLRLGAVGRPLGALSVHSGEPAAFGPAVHRLGRAFASIAATAVHAHRADHSIRARGRPSGHRTAPALGGFPATGQP